MLTLLHAARFALCLSVDAFYASVEIRDRPELADKPVAVGGLSMISTSNYVARRYGVRSAMPGFIALKLCPHLVFVPHNWVKYQAVAESTREIFREYDPEMESGSLDEAYLDVTRFVRREQRDRRRRASRGLQPRPLDREARKKRKVEKEGTEGEEQQQMSDDPAATAAAAASSSSSAVAAAASSSAAAAAVADPDADLSDLDEHANTEDTDDDDDDDAPLSATEIASNAALALEVATVIRARIWRATHLTASAGIGCNRMLAKICTDFGKPDGQFQLASSVPEILSFMRELPVRKLPGVGKVMEQLLAEMGIKSCGEVVSSPERCALLFEVFSADTASWLVSVSLGIAGTHHHAAEDRVRKSISTERTFRALTRWADLESKLHELAASLAEDIAKSNCRGGKNVTLKLKSTDFSLSTRSITLERYIAGTRDELIKYGMQLLREEVERVQNLNHKGFAATATAATTAAVAQGVAASPLKATSAGAAASPSATVTHAASPSSAHASSSALHSTAHQHNRDGVLSLRLMGLRLSSLKEDAPPEPQAAPGSQSILRFVKAEPGTEHASSATSSASDSGVKRERKSTHPTDADISSFFQSGGADVAPSPIAAAASASAPSRGKAASTLDRFFAAKSLGPAFSSSAQSHRPASSGAASAAAPSAPVAPSASECVLDLTDDASWRDDDEDTPHAEGEGGEEAAWLADWMALEHGAKDKAGSSAPSTGAEAAPPAPFPSASSAAASAAAVSSAAGSSAAPSAIASAAASPAAASPSSSSSSLVCPLCSRDLGNEVGNAELNRHVDLCLRGAAGSGGGAATASGAAGKSGAKRKHTASATAAAAPPKGMQTLAAILARNKPPSRDRSAAASSAAPIELD